ncbi:Bet1-like SNARE 1-1 [Sesamum angolense]|uniref:Bet1-like SNARE 1-1 n=1 Tax=Sesamum angolense TaxID=2727404 RepID=A0AAE1WEJ2_9LAMI|nr:Bet1-like SNARE 1-1 [Sesamum angolense]
MPFFYRVVIKLKGVVVGIVALDHSGSILTWPVEFFRGSRELEYAEALTIRAALFDGIEEGGIRASPSYSSHEIDEQENDKAMDGLQDRVNLLKRLLGDIHEEVESHNAGQNGSGHWNGNRRACELYGKRMPVCFSNESNHDCYGEAAMAH